MESENFNWSCRTHQSEFGGEMWWCCGKIGKDAIGCKFSKKHHTVLTNMMIGKFSRDFFEKKISAKIFATRIDGEGRDSFTAACKFSKLELCTSYPVDYNSVYNRVSFDIYTVTLILQVVSSCFIQ
jgi:hypothetical protein